MRSFALAVAVCCYLGSGLALAQDTAKQLAGSWKLTSWTIQIIGGDATEPFGSNPKGRALFTPDGHVGGSRWTVGDHPGCRIKGGTDAHFFLRGNYPWPSR